MSIGLEISDISRKTGITSRYLKAIERGDFAALPGDIYVRGYIKEYAKCLNVPFSEALEEYETYLRRKRDERNRMGEGTKTSSILLKLERFFHHKEDSEAGQGQPCR